MTSRSIAEGCGVLNITFDGIECPATTPSDLALYFCDGITVQCDTKHLIRVLSC